MQQHTLQRKTSRQRSQRVGRGGTRGKTSGRGHKGQKARAGHKIRPAVRDAIKQIPKLRGESASGRNYKAPKPVGVNVAMLQSAFEKGGEVTPQTLVEAGVCRKRGGKYPKVKILGTGELTAQVSVSGCTVSATAAKKITAAGGSVAS